MKKSLVAATLASTLAACNFVTHPDGPYPVFINEQVARSVEANTPYRASIRATGAEGHTANVIYIAPRSHTTADTVRSTYGNIDQLIMAPEMPGMYKAKIVAGGKNLRTKELEFTLNVR